MDANIKTVNELSSLAAMLQSSQETIAADCTSIASFMDQKLARLLNLRSIAESIFKQVETEYYDAFRNYACVVSHTQDISKLQENLGDLGQRLREVKRMYSEINTSVGVCRGMVLNIVSETNCFRQDVSNIIGVGRQFVRKSSNDLITYLEHSQKK